MYIIVIIILISSPSYGPSIAITLCYYLVVIFISMLPYRQIGDIMVQGGLDITIRNIGKDTYIRVAIVCMTRVLGWL